MVSQVGYSSTPLAKKLGLKDGQNAAFIGLPNALAWLKGECTFARVETPAAWDALSTNDHDYIHLFTDSAATVEVATPALRDRIKQDGMIWMSWSKKASKVPTDVTEDTIRTRALQDILVDVKVCAVDDIWSGLKLMIRKERRT
ncbi:MAG: hypothetical protein KJN60_04030 [Boseongicola sp.]|nr:hypothetical protein [Boseongicola sp.]